MNTKKPSIGIIGPNAEKCNQQVYEFAYELGTELSKRDAFLISGGKLGIMEAVFKGAKIRKPETIKTIGIIPEDNKSEANKYCDIVIPTGIGTARNKIVVNTADIIIAIAGGAGTLSEIAFAWQMGKPVIACTGFEGWAKQLAGKVVDNQQESMIYSVGNLAELLNQLDGLIVEEIRN